MKRKTSDFLLNALTYSCSSIAIFILAAIIMFVVSQSLGKLDFAMIKGDYQTQNFLATLDSKELKLYPEGTIKNDKVFWSEKWGIGVVDFVSHENMPYILVEKLADDSPLNSLIDNNGVQVIMGTGSAIIRLNTIDENGVVGFTGTQLGQSAEEFIVSLEQAADIESIYFQILGGGIRGPLIATLWLILISLLIVLPIGIATAIYLSEYAGKKRFTAMLKTSIETLSGVPSIIFGLMGVAVFFPLTSFFGAKGLSILLGGLTMSVILLPTVIRSTQEALLVIPQPLKDGSLALGANQSQTIFKVVLPCAMPGILTGVLLSVGRIIGESAALIYTMGTFANDKPQILQPGSSLAVHIWSIMSGEQPNFELAAAVSVIILATVFVLNFTVKFVSKKLSKAWY